MQARLFTYCLFVCFLLMRPLPGSAQQTNPPSGHHGETVSLFTATSPDPNYELLVKDATWLQLNTEALTAVFQKQAQHMVFEIPMPDGNKIQVNLEAFSIFGNDFIVKTSDGKELDYTPGMYYRGEVKGYEGKSFATISIFQNEVMGVISFGGYNYNLGPTGETPASSYVFYKDADLIQKPAFSCGVSDDDIKPGENSNPHNVEKSPSCHKVKMYIQADYELYQRNGSNATNTANYITNLFASLANLYSGIDVQMRLSELFIYTFSDPYNDSNKDQALTDFANAMTQSGYNGNIAHLMSGDNTNGGKAYGFTGLCNTFANGCCYSGSLFALYPGFPTYSWEVNCTTHETGHLLGSRHTHACVWGPDHDQPIDVCGPLAGFTENGCNSGPIPPPGGGTIMSYCHLLPSNNPLFNVGINFANGFGTEPGNLINGVVHNNAMCLDCSQSGALSCVLAPTVYCGEHGTYNTVNSPSNVNTYAGCPWNEDGPEKVFKFTVINTISCSFSITGMSSNLDIFLLNNCSPSSCIFYDDKEINNYTLSPGTYYIVVDGNEGAIGDFQLNVTCSGYCQNAGLINSQCFIQAIAQIGTLANVTGNNGGYYFSPALAGSVQRGNSNFATLVTGYTGAIFPVYWYIFLDLNVDHDFTDPGELVFYTPTPVTDFAGGPFTIPADAPHSITRMRVIVSRTPLTDACTQPNGEVEDYMMEVLPFCAAQGSTQDEYIDEITVGNLHQASGNNFGYTEYTTDYPRQFVKGLTYDVSLIAGFTNTPYYENFRMWIDYNQNGNFDAGEAVFEGIAQGVGPLTGSFTIPETAPSGLTGMRISMKYGAYPDGCPNGSYMGETEDYMINIVPYCISEMEPLIDYIYRVRVGSMVNTSGYNRGYKDFTSITPPDLYLGSTVDVTLQSSGGDYKNWGVWLDYNLDKVFTEDEKVFSGTSSGSYGLSGSFTVPTNFYQNTLVPMRVTLRKEPNPTGCFQHDANGVLNEGETEDYLVRIKLPCETPPATASAILQSPTSAVIIWEKSTYGSKYNLRYRQVGTTAWTTIGVSYAFYYKIITGLQPNTTYEYQLRTLCSGTYTNWSTVWTFSTTPEANCAVPNPNMALSYTPTSERVYWQYNASATSYQIRYRLYGTTAWTIKNTTVPNNVLTGLTPATKYTYQLRSKCGGVFSNWTVSYYFTTLSSPALVQQEDELGTAYDAPEEDPGDQPSLYPNPVRETFRIDTKGISVKQAMIVNMNGGIVQRLTPEMMDTEISAKELASGVYFVTLTLADGERKVLKFVVWKG